MMLKAILNNPYRILGVYSNSPKKEQIANKGKMQAFLRVKKSMPFPLDLKGILPEVNRTQEVVDNADSELALSTGQIKHAQFWFVNKTPIDGIAFNHLLGGNLDSAMEMWKKSSNMSSLQNLFVCYLIREDYKTAIIECAIPLYNNHADSFISMIDEKGSMSISELAESIIETLTEEGVNTTHIANYITDVVWKNHIESKRVTPLLSQIDSLVLEAKSAKGKGETARLNAGYKLNIASKPLLATIKSILPDSDIRYQMIADKVSQEILQCSIDYYNDTSDFDAPAKALSLCDYAKSVAVGSAAKQRCQENFDVIKKAYDNMPPLEVAKEAKEIDNLFVWYRKQKKTSSNGLELLKKAQKSLISIKEKLGKNHKYYLETSSILGSAALSNIIDEVNDAQKEDKPNPLSGLLGNLIYNTFEEQERRRQKAYTLKIVLASAWKTIVYIDLLDKTEEFKNHYQPNRKTLHSIIDELKGFDYPDENYIIKGCAHGIFADFRFFWCDSEYFAACSSKSDYEVYIQRFPSGNHVEEANKRIEEINVHNKKMYKYFLIAVAIFLLGFIIISSAHVISLYSSSIISKPQKSENVYYSYENSDENEYEEQEPDYEYEDLDDEDEFDSNEYEDLDDEDEFDSDEYEDLDDEDEFDSNEYEDLENENENDFDYEY